MSCQHIFKSGPKKAKICGRNIRKQNDDMLCGEHSTRVIQLKIDRSKTRNCDKTYVVTRMVDDKEQTKTLKRTQAFELQKVGWVLVN